MSRYVVYQLLWMALVLGLILAPIPRAWKAKREVKVK